jgi:hypothetical protein
MQLYRYLTGPDDSSFCHRVSEALNRGWKLYGAPSLTYDPKKKRVICGQVVIKTVKGKKYSPDLELSRQ